MKTHTFKNSISRTRGFTLIEILLAIGILAILATAVIIAINPARQFAEARNTQRWGDIHAIMNATYQYATGHKGAIPSEILSGSSPYDICLPDASSCSTMIGLPSLTENAKYLTAVPVDPSCPDECGSNSTGYSISKNDDGRIHVIAPHAELGETIELVQ